MAPCETRHSCSEAQAPNEEDERKESERGREGRRKAAFIIASKTKLRWHARRSDREAARLGSHTYLHTSHSIDRAPNWLPGCLARCTAGFQPGSTTTRARRRTHIYIKPLSAYGRTIGRSAGRSESGEERARKEEGREEGERQGRGRERRTGGVISFAPNVHAAAAVAGGRAGERHGRSYK